MLKVNLKQFIHQDLIFDEIDWYKSYSEATVKIDACFSNTDCRWELSTTSGERIIVDVMESYFEGSPGCSYDYLGIYDGMFAEFYSCYVHRSHFNSSINCIACNINHKYKKTTSLPQYSE